MTSTANTPAIKRPPRHRPDREGAWRSLFESNKKIILATQELCAICGQPVDKSLRPPHPLSATVDHIIPIAKGGHPAALDNLQLAHRHCNELKGAKLSPDVPKKEIDYNRQLPHSRNWLSD